MQLIDNQTWEELNQNPGPGTYSHRENACITVNPLYNDTVCSKLSLTLK